jgi:hypothetical protein
MWTALLTSLPLSLGAFVSDVCSSWYLDSFFVAAATAHATQRVEEDFLVPACFLGRHKGEVARISISEAIFLKMSIIS